MEEDTVAQRSRTASRDSRDATPDASEHPVAKDGSGQSTLGSQAAAKPESSAQNKRARRRAKKARGRAKQLRTTPLRTSDGTFEQLVRSRLDAEISVDQPVALISQAPRSGGTLLRNLFDGHPQCHVHPYEWHFGPTRRFEWPKLRPEGTPELWWSRLREPELGRRFISGVRRNPTKYRGKDAPPRGEIYPLLLPPLMHKQIFLGRIQEREIAGGDREILNAYLTGLFNAWLNNHSLDNGDKRWVVAFAPRLAWGESRQRFFDAYPDGHLISILRSPLSWMASARGRGIKGAENDERLIAMWNRSTHEMIEAKGERDELVSIVRFEDLVEDAAGSMRMLARKLDIDFVDTLTEPTFNSRPIGANSSYANVKGGLITDPLTRHKKVLSDADERTVSEQCGDLYEEALKLVAEPGPRAAESRKPAKRRQPAKSKKPAKPKKEPKVKASEETEDQASSSS
jgi:hypothetical protein